MLYSDKLKLLIEANDVKQIDLSKILDLSKSRLSEYINENDIIPLKYLNTLCNYFDVSIDYIFGFTSIDKYKNTNNDIDNIKVGVRLKEFRKENKLTQVKLAKELNTVHPVIVNYEKGKHLIATPFLYTICKKYSISADYLLGRVDEPKYLK